MARSLVNAAFPPEQGGAEPPPCTKFNIPSRRGEVMGTIHAVGRRMAALVLAFAAMSASAGSIFVTGHDPIWHANFGANSAGAINLATTGIDYARNGSALPFLFIESKSVPVPSGNAHSAPFLTSALGYAPASYVVMDAADLGALPDFRAALNAFSAIVVASDHGGMLTGAELSFLN